MSEENGIEEKMYGRLAHKNKSKLNDSDLKMQMVRHKLDADNETEEKRYAKSKYEISSQSLYKETVNCSVASDDHIMKCSVEIASDASGRITDRRIVEETKCKFCKEIFSSCQLLEKHSAQEIYNCDVCRESFTSCKARRVHNKSHKYRCSECCATFSCKTKHEVHMLLHSKDHRCPSCHENFHTRLELRKHMKNAHKNIVEIQCDLCGKMCSKNHFRRHMDIHSGNKPYSCKSCGKSFLQKGHYTLHLKYHRGQKDHLCDTCGKKFYQKSELKIHNRIHLGEKPYKCQVCLESFTSLHALRVHREEHSTEKQVCQICQRKFSHKYALYAHYRMHSFAEVEKLNSEFVTSVWKRIKTIKCQDWGKGDNQNFGKSIFKCDECGRSIVSKASFIAHKRIHTGEKPFKCSVCGKSFRLQSIWLNHSRIHTGERPFKCLVCDKRFTQRAHLSAHRILHTGTKPYVCNVCGTAFAAKSNLTSHLKIHNKNGYASGPPTRKSFICENCGENFGAKKKYSDHRKSCMISNVEDTNFTNTEKTVGISLEECESLHDQHITSVHNVSSLHPVNQVNYIISEDGKTISENIIVYESPVC
ncbi:hypothetical protein SK128_020996 [Halocaridina rubra]|uniref:C2H2-type domain-containing protein n=1 Tax=Halocaridina rubra TaxID=373956 RepID=A0AAN8XK57_HALRR